MKLTVDEFCKKVNAVKHDLELLRELADYLTSHRVEYEVYQRNYMAEYLIEKIQECKLTPQPEFEW